MICPGFKWKPWPEIRARSLEIHHRAYAELNARMDGVFDPAKEMAGFYDAEDAWLEDSAKAIGIDRSRLERLAVAGQIQWRENYGHGHEVRYDGQSSPMTIRPAKA